MNPFFFWNQWRASYRLLYLFGLLNLLTAIGFYVYFYTLGNDAIIAWEKVGDVEVFKVIVHQFTKNFFSFAAPADSYLISESFAATNISLNYLPYYLHFFFLLTGFLLFLTAISDLKRIGYFVGILVMVFLFASMQLEILGIFSEIYDKAYLILILLSYGLVSYYFHYFNKRVIFPYRFLVYLIITIGLIYIGIEYSKKDIPILYPLNYGIFVPLVIATIFICFNAHENIRGMLSLVSLGNDNKSFRHLTILVIIYFLNLTYCYFKFTDGFDLGIFYIHPFFLLVATILVGIWGFKARESQYFLQMQFTPTGAFVYLGLAIMTVSSISFALGTANNPLIETFEDITLYALLSWGAVTYTYIIANFLDPLSEGKPVHKFFYRHSRLDFLTSYTFGLVLAIILVFKSGMIAYKQSFAGYYNGLGDISHVEKDYYASKQYYNLALGYDTRNHRSYYSLGSIAREEGNELVANIFFTDALQKTPSPYAYANIANYQLNANKTLEAILTLKEGVQKFPKNGELQNNLALVFNKIQLPDSVFFYFDMAQRYSKMPEVPASNLYGLLTKYDYLNYLDTAYQWTSDKPYVGRAANQLAFYNKYNKVKPRVLNTSFLPDSSLNTLQLSYLYNYALNQAQFANDSLVSLVKYYEQIPENSSFTSYLQLARALILFEKNEFKDAVALLKEAYRYAGFTNQEYPNLLGIWHYQMEEYLTAADYFKVAWQRGHQPAGLNLGLSLSELDDKSEAIEHWTLLKRVGNKEQKAVAKDMLNILSENRLATNWHEKASISDTELIRYLHYQQNNLTEKNFQQIYEKITADEYKVVAIAERILFLVSKERPEEAEYLTNQLQQIPVSEPVKSFHDRAILAYWNAKKQYNKVFLNTLETASFGKVFTGLGAYYKAAYLAANKEPSKSIGMFEEAIKTLPFESRVYTDLAHLYTSIDSVDLAYLVALEGVKTNEKSPVLWKNYVMKCAELDYTSFAEDGLKKLEILLSAEEYKKTKTEYNQKKEAFDQKMESWR